MVRSAVRFQVVGKDLSLIFDGDSHVLETWMGSIGVLRFFVLFNSFQETPGDSLALSRTRFLRWFQSLSRALFTCWFRRFSLTLTTGSSVRCQHRRIKFFLRIKPLISHGTKDLSSVVGELGSGFFQLVGHVDPRNGDQMLLTMGFEGGPVDNFSDCGLLEYSCLQESITISCGTIVHLGFEADEPLRRFSSR